MPMHTFINILPYSPVSGGFPNYRVSILDQCAFQILVHIFPEVENDFGFFVQDSSVLDII